MLDTVRADGESLHRLAACIDGGTLLIAAVGLFLLGTWLVSRATSGLARKQPRAALLVRIGAAPALALGAFVLAYLVPVPTEVGSWVCKRCGAGTRELRYLDVTVRTTSEVPADCTPGGPGAGQARAPEHAWAPVGCHSHGRESDGSTSVSCHYFIF